MHPDQELLAALALGETIPTEAAAHALECPTCAAEVAELRHTAALARASRQADLLAPPTSVWAAIAARTANDQSEPAGLERDDTEQADSGIPGVAGDELAVRRARRRGVRRWVLAGTAAGVALGVLGTQVVGALRSPEPTVVASAPLKTLDGATLGGDAELVDKPTGLTLRLSVEPLDAKGGYLEVWLINTDLTRMVSVGVLPNNDTTATFLVAPGMMDQGYRIIDISREQFDDRPQHSGDSLLRGTLA
ncbi:MAG: anti-sigma factor [Propionicimonas sp.]|uniref:hypothetical protein n=1 Tax=Propionicimonas sp. TaxID=1955623 RepID=UPI003D152784